MYPPNRVDTSPSIASGDSDDGFLIPHPVPTMMPVIMTPRSRSRSRSVSSIRYTESSSRARSRSRAASPESETVTPAQAGHVNLTPIRSPIKPRLSSPPPRMLSPQVVVGPPSVLPPPPMIAPQVVIQPPASVEVMSHDRGRPRSRSPGTYPSIVYPSSSRSSSRSPVRHTGYNYGPIIINAPSDIPEHSPPIIIQQPWRSLPTKLKGTKGDANKVSRERSVSRSSSRSRHHRSHSRDHRRHSRSRSRSWHRSRSRSQRRCPPRPTRIRNRSPVYADMAPTPPPLPYSYGAPLYQPYIQPMPPMMAPLTPMAFGGEHQRFNFADGNVAFQVSL